jgi:transposase-like protein
MRKKRHITQYTQDERLAIMQAYDSSGISLHEFCEQTGVNKRTVSNWMKDRRHKTGMFAPEAELNQSFVSLPVRASEPEAVVPALQQETDQKTQHQQQGQPLSQPITLKREKWTVEIPSGCERTDVLQLLSVLEDLYAV